MVLVLVVPLKLDSLACIKGQRFLKNLKTLSLKRAFSIDSGAATTASRLGQPDLAIATLNDFVQVIIGLSPKLHVTQQIPAGGRNGVKLRPIYSCNRRCRHRVSGRLQ